VFAILGALLLSIGLQTLKNATLIFALEHLLLQLPAILMFSTLPLLALLVARPRDNDTARAALVAALFFQGMMAFQIYPRGGFNIAVMLGTLAPVFGYLAWRGYALATGGPTPTGPMLRTTAFALVALIPALYAHDKVRYALTAPSARELPQRTLHHPALAGIHPKPTVWKQPKLESFNALTRALERAEPRDAPLFVLHNEPMIYFLSDRTPLFADHIQTFFLLSWEMWPPQDPTTPSAADLIRDFENHPDAIIVTRRGDKTAKFIFRAFPSLQQYISENYRTTGRFGEYRVLRRASVE
jgi:hypothetical protein